MPADLPSELMRMVGCGLTVAAVAGPVGLIAWRIARRAGEPVLPPLKPWRVPWTWLEVVIAFLVLAYAIPVLVITTLSESDLLRQIYGHSFPGLPGQAGPSVEASASVAGAAATLASTDQTAVLTAVRGLWVGLLSFPLQLGFVILAWRSLYRGTGSAIGWRAIPARVALGILAWSVVTPIVLGVHLAVNVAFTRLGWEVEPHSLSRLAAVRPLMDQILFFINAGGTAALMEELMFRWLLLGWLVGGRPLLFPDASTASRPPASDGRVWPILVIGVVFAAVSSTGAGEWVPSPTRGPVLFAVILLAGWFGLRRLTRKRRTLGAVYASAALFAVVHSEVWPTPLPLFILGLGLGWLALRTRGVLAPAIVHGLFNAVSVLFVLRSGAA